MSGTVASEGVKLLEQLGINGIPHAACWGQWVPGEGAGEVAVTTPVDGTEIGHVKLASAQDYDVVMGKLRERFETWRMVPAPKRGEVVRQLGNEFRKHKKELGALISWEMGKIRSEGEGEVQEIIDIADFAVGLSRQLYGLTMHSERPGHRMYEQWHPLGVIGVVTAFNFPMAVWAWNAMIAAVCGDTVLLKPSHKTPFCAIAIQTLCNRVMKANDCEGVFGLVIGKREVGEMLVNDPRVPLVSATGSCNMGRSVGMAVAQRLGRSLLELGGNNAIIVDENADLDMALTGIVFGAVGTAGQRCTSTRRVFLNESIAERFTGRLVKAYQSVKVGNPLDDRTLMGPLVDEDAVVTFEEAIAAIRAQGGEILTGGKRIDGPGHFVEPTLVKATVDMPITKDETFAPILYVFTYKDLDEAIHAQNDVMQGLSSAIYTTNLLRAETFLSARGSDCGIANVNIGTSGAEIGGAFGGEKETGGGREAGSDSWKIYMRRQTCTLNWSKDVALAQGVEFDIS
ncbi:aldehyde dehydrogenase family protein [bacterium]|nr:aldehyde dehydrogenase family protein [bacterium]